MEERIELSPNCSLTPTAARMFFVCTCLFSLAFAMIFVVHGFWPVLPFWALEMVALGLALHTSMRRRFYTQTLLITDSMVSLVTRSRRGEAKQESGPSVRGRQLPHRRGKMSACPAFARLGGRDERIAAA
jgi:uncharacterized membrane protein